MPVLPHPLLKNQKQIFKLLVQMISETDLVLITPCNSLFFAEDKNFAVAHDNDYGQKKHALFTSNGPLLLKHPFHLNHMMTFV